MSRANNKIVKSVKALRLSTSIAVLVPSDFKHGHGVTITKQGEGLRGEQVRVIDQRELIFLAEASRGSSPDWVPFLYGIKKLQGLEDESQDPIECRSAWELIAPKFRIDPKKVAPPRQLKATILLPALSIAFEGVRLTFWYTRPDKQGKKQLLPGLYCPDTRTGLAARWLLDRNVRICTHCQTIFIAKRPKQTAHSVECREAHRAARWHARRKLKEAA